MINSVHMAQGGIVVGKAIMMDPGKKAKGRKKDFGQLGHFLGSLDGFTSSYLYHGISFESEVEIADDCYETFGWVQPSMMKQAPNMRGDEGYLVGQKAVKVNINKSENSIIICYSDF